MAPGHYTSVPVNHDRLLLAQPVSPSLGLQVIVGVPVAVIDDDSVSCGQVDAQASCFGGQQEDKVVLRAAVELVDAGLAL